MGCFISCCRSAISATIGAYFDKDLKAATKGDDFSLQDEEFLCKVVEVYDGDTIRVVFRRRGELMQHRVRMAGYDSPEMKPPRKDPNRDVEIRAAIAARDALKRMIQGSAPEEARLVWLKCGKPDKYGRLLGTIYQRGGCFGCLKGTNVNQWMMDNGHGVPYDGGKKRAFVASKSGAQAEEKKREGFEIAAATAATAATAVTAIAERKHQSEEELDAILKEELLTANDSGTGEDSDSSSAPSSLGNDENASAAVAEAEAEAVHV